MALDHMSSVDGCFQDIKIFAAFSNSAMSEKTRLRKSKPCVIVIFQTDAKGNPTREIRIRASWYPVEG